MNYVYMVATSTIGDIYKNAETGYLGFVVEGQFVPDRDLTEQFRIEYDIA